MTRKARRSERREKAAPDTVCFDLTPEQAEQLAPLLRRRGARRARLLMTPIPFWSVEEGRMRFHLRAKFLPRARARALLQFLQEEAEPAAGDGGVET
jgi:hypothetical protein